MATSRLNALAAAVLLCTATVAHAIEKDARQQPISLKVTTYEVDFRTGKTLMHNVAISQGDISITADRAEATGLDFNDSHWVFSGDVHINAEQRGSMRSDRAEVEFRNNRIARATVRGNPAQFEQTRADSKQMARGRAGEIVYEVGAGTVRLANEAWLTNGQNEISGPLLVYNIRLQKVQAATEPGSSQRVRITIVPKAAQPAPPPPPQ